MRILIVDDEAGIRDVCSRALRGAGHEVAACVSGEEALALLPEHWDLVVSDLQMPGSVDGNEVVRRARAAGTGGVALMTAYPTLGTAVSAIRDGACDYLLKPFSLDALLSLVRRRETGRPAEPVREPRRLREATVLFADVRGFTAYSSGVAADAAAAALDGMLGCFIEAVHAEGGTVHKFIGDGAMALFGLPVPHADPAAAAARAALRARDGVRRLGALRFGFGLNSGLVAAGTMGTRDRAEFDVIGSVVNLAARIEEAAVGGQILVGPGARAALAPDFRLGPPARLSLDGFKDLVEVSALVGPEEA